MQNFQVQQYPSWTSFFNDVQSQCQHFQEVRERSHLTYTRNQKKLQDDPFIQVELPNGILFQCDLILKPRLQLTGKLLVPRFGWSMPFTIQRSVMEDMNYAEWWNNSAIRHDKFYQFFNQNGRISEYDYSGTPTDFQKIMDMFSILIVQFIMMPDRDERIQNFFQVAR